MPPNIKFPLNVPLGDELINVSQTNSRAVPPPLTLDHDSGDETYFLHDIEEDVSNHVEPSITAPRQHEANHDHPHPSSSEEHNHDHEHRHAHRVIKHLASQISDPEELTIDEKRLARAVQDAGEYAYGVIACEVWLLEEEKLVRPKGGWWHNIKLYQHSLALDTLATTEPPSMMPGVDLPGILWAESHREEGTLRTSHSGSFFARTHLSKECLDQHTATEGLPNVTFTGSNTGLFGGTGPSMDDLAAALHLSTTTWANPHALLWRDLMSIAKDPDSAKTARLGLLIQAGLHAAAAIPFHIKGSHVKGLVIYYARCHTRTKLHSNVANDAYLRASAQMIGHAAALSETRRASVEARRRQNLQAKQRFTKNLRDFYRNTGSNIRDFVPAQIEKGVNEQPFTEEALDLAGIPPEETQWDKVHRRFQTWRNKCLGGNLQVPPALSVRQTLWTIFGAFCGLLVLSSLNEYCKILSDDDYFLLIGPFGALMTLQYGLTAAPASQPRNAILGQAVSGAVSLAFTYIPEYILPTWLRRAVGPAFAIGTMVKLGVTHPPAGAHAVLYASGQYNFGFYALVVLSSAISVIPATLVNNLSSKRQYPTYWTMVQLPKLSRETKSEDRG